MKSWTDEEVKILKENYNKLSNEGLIKLFPNKSFQAIYKKAYNLGLRKTPEIEFLNRSEVRKGEKNSNWKGGRKKTPNGYVQVHMPNHPRADKNGYVMEHIVVFEEVTGITVPCNCCVHHLNGIKGDNRIENLCMMEFGAHTVMHHTGHKNSAETREKISQKAKERLKDETKHPSYKQVDIQKCLKEREMGKTVSQICKENGITRRTYYNKLRKQEEVHEQC